MTPQPNPLSHVDRVLRLLHTANSIVIHVQEQAMKVSCGAGGMNLPFFTRKLLVKVIQDNFAELFALMQAIRLNLENLEEQLQQEEQNHE